MDPFTNGAGAFPPRFSMVKFAIVATTMLGFGGLGCSSNGASPSPNAIMDAGAEGEDGGENGGVDAAIEMARDSSAETLAPDAFGNGPDSGARPWTCAEMEAAFVRATGKPGRACVERVPDEEVWRSIAIAEGGAVFARSTKYFVPWRADVRVPLNFLDAHSWLANIGMAPPSLMGNPWHMLFAAVYLTTKPPHLAYLGPNREVVTGNLYELVPGASGPSYGYTIHDQAGLTCDEQKRVHAEMKAAFLPGPLNRLVLVAGDQPPANCQLPLLVLVN